MQVDLLAMHADVAIVPARRHKRLTQLECRGNADGPLWTVIGRPRVSRSAFLTASNACQSEAVDCRRAPELGSALQTVVVQIDHDDSRRANEFVRSKAPPADRPPRRSPTVLPGGQPDH